MKREDILTSTPSTQGRLFPLASFVVLAIIFGLLVARSHGLNPTVFADEWYYSKMARLQPLAEAIVPSYLYLWVFGAANACGNGFLECARIGNALLFVAAAPFLYLTARSVTGRPTAALIALLATLAPLNLFTTYFMPEATYYFAFCVLSWVALTRRHWHWALHALACGALLGVMSLVKVHALFLLPALLLFLVYSRWQAGHGWLGSALLSMALGAAAMFAVKFGISYLLAGEPGLSLLGPFYSGGTGAASANKLRLLKPAFVIGRAHLMLLAVGFGLPLALMAASVLRPARRAQAGQAELVSIYTLLILGAAAGMTILYTATLATPDSNEGLRMHVRYYDFVFPMLWIVAAAALERRGAPAPAGLRWTLAVLLVAIQAIAIVKLPTYTINAVDGPEAHALRLTHAGGLTVLALQVLALLLWAAGRASALRLFLFVLAPLVIVSGIVGNQRELSHFVDDQDADLAGKAAHRIVPPSERSKITVAGSGLGQIMRAQFHIDDKDTAMLELPDGAPLESYQLPVRNKWLVVFGKHTLPTGVQPVASTKHYALLRMDTQRRVIGNAQLNQPFGPQGLVASGEGLSHIEAFGRWSDAKNVVLHFNAPLPRRAYIVIKAWAYGDNTELPFTLRIGDSSARFRLSGAPQEVGLRLETDGQQRDLVIEVPHPVSPQSYGDPRDPRLLGMALAEIEISTPVD